MVDVSARDDDVLIVAEHLENGALSVERQSLAEGRLIIARNFGGVLNQLAVVDSISGALSQYLRDWKMPTRLTSLKMKSEFYFR